MPKFGDTKYVKGVGGMIYGTVSCAKAGGGAPVVFPKWFAVNSGADMSIIDLPNLQQLEGAGGATRRRPGTGHDAAGTSMDGVIGPIFTFMVGGQARKCSAIVAIDNGATFSYIGVDQMAYTNAGLGNLSAGGLLFDGFVDDPHAANMGNPPVFQNS